MTTTTQDAVNLQTAAALLGKQPNTLKQWFRLGCPVEQKGNQKQEWRIRVADVVAWRERQLIEAAEGDLRALDLNEAKRRKAVAEAALAELELARRQKEIIPAPEVEKVWGDMLGAFRARMLGLPSQAAPLVMAADDVGEGIEVLRQHVHAALSELAEYDAGDYA